MKSLPKVIFLDWHKTLSNSRFWGHLASQNHGAYEKIESALFRKHIDKITPWMLGKLTSWDICKILAKETGLKYDFLHNELVHSCKNMEFISSMVPNFLQKIKERGIKLMIATDNMDTFSRYTFESVNKNGLFDGFLNSYELGNFKYDFQGGGLPFFDTFLAKNNLVYQEVVLIDDSIDKKGNLTRLGFEVIYINEDLPLEKVLASYV